MNAPLAIILLIICTASACTCWNPIYSVEETKDQLNGTWHFYGAISCERDSTFGEPLPVNPDLRIHFQGDKLYQLDSDSTCIHYAWVNVRKAYDLTKEMEKISPCVVELDDDLYGEWGGTRMVWHLESLSEDTMRYRVLSSGKCDRIYLARECPGMTEK